MMEADSWRGQFHSARAGSHEDQTVLILNQDSTPCEADKCEALPALLQRSLSVRCVQARCADQLPHGVSSVPDLVLVRPAASEKAHELIASCKEKWTRASILALLCARWDRLVDNLPSFLTRVDDFLSCPFQEAELFLRIRRLLQTKATAGSSHSQRIKERLHLESLVGESEVFMNAVKKISLLANSNAPVLISGETGTGKELFARALHYEGPRRGKPFIPVNCGALPDHLFENELFGHAKGAFTDAGSVQKGLIAEAEGGTLFLDEIDALSSSAQIKLLRFLQDGEFRLLGSSRNLTADVRVIAATNTDLRPRVELQQFRADVYHRINVLSLAIPALRDRASDIPLLATCFLDRYARQYGRGPAKFSPAALQKLIAYHWPGNVRELEATAQRVVVLNSISIVEPEHIEVPGPYSDDRPINNTLSEAKSVAVGGFERRYLATLLAAYQGNVSHAARAAGKDRRTLQRLLRKYGLDRHSFHSA
jgi:DNA-binding NtrC family response regulator